jgi:thioredoxin-dependent peroxiredoxin
MLKLGDKIADLRGQTTDGEVRLRSLKGKFVVVYFYPKDSTTGCTREAQDFRDLYKTFVKMGADVLGVSRDPLKSHDSFRAKQALPFTLVSDADESWCHAFDVIHEKVLYGRRYLGIVRSTFLIDPEGRLRREWRGIKVPGHAAAVLEALGEEST